MTRQSWINAAPAIAALTYPYLLQAFHFAVAFNGALAGLILLASYCVPLLGFLVAVQIGEIKSPNALEVYLKVMAWLTFASPPLFVFDGVLMSMTGIAIPDITLWFTFWTVAVLIGCPLFFSSYSLRRVTKIPLGKVSSSRLRVGHGVSAVAIILLFLGMHLINHLAGLFGADRHRELMNVFRLIYRSKVVEPAIILLFLFQAVSGVMLLRRSATFSADFFKSLQLASGSYLLFFILAHMNSVFLYARALGGIETDWDFATGAPAGLLKDSWNIRLVPHYSLGVFLILCHLVTGMRVVALAHGYSQESVNRFSVVGVCLSALMAAGIILGMIGIHIHI